MNISGPQALIKAKKENSSGWELENQSHTKIGMLENQIISSNATTQPYILSRNHNLDVSSSELLFTFARKTIISQITPLIKF
jgi:hypothetical protein